MFHHHAHTSKLLVKPGDRVQQGQVIGNVGKSGTQYAHDHYEIRKTKPPTWTFYPKGWTRERVAAEYVDPRQYVDERQNIPVPWTSKNAGYKYLEYAAPQDTFHPGTDFNSGYGDQDLGNPIKATTDGIVRYVGTDGSWGLHVWIEETIMNIQLPITIVANNNNWESLAQQLSHVSEWFANYSKGKISVTFDVVKTGFQNIPLAPFLDFKSVDVNWYRQNITPLTRGKGSIFLLNPEQYQNSATFGFMTYGDPQRPVRMEVSAQEDEVVGNAPIFVHRAFHEICHMLFFLTGQADKTHEYLYRETDKKAELLSLLDYAKLQTAVEGIKPADKIKMRSIGWNDAEKGIYVPFDSLERQKTFLAKVTTLFPDYELDPKEFNLSKRPW